MYLFKERFSKDEIRKSVGDIAAGLDSSNLFGRWGRLTTLNILIILLDNYQSKETKLFPNHPDLKKRRQTWQRKESRPISLPKDILKKS